MYRTLCCLLGLSMSAGLLAAGQGSPPIKSRKPAVGFVVGYVFDAETGEPVEGARVVAENNGTFPEKGDSCGATDKMGRYQVKANIGEVKKTTKVSAKSFLGTILTGGLIPTQVSEIHRTTIELPLANVSVQATGYKRFEEPVRVSFPALESFTVYMDPIVLTRTAGPEVSFTGPMGGWERVLEFTASPTVVAPKDRMEFTARLRIPRDRRVRYVLWLKAPAGLLDKEATELKSQSGSGQEKQGELTFAARRDLSGKFKGDHGEVTLTATRDVDPLPLAGLEPITILVIKDQSQRAAAQACEQALKLLAQGQLEAAAEKSAEATAGGTTYGYAYEVQGDILQRLNKNDQAADAYKRLADLQPDDLENALPKYALALAAAGKANEAVLALKEAERRAQPKDRKKKPELPAAFHAAMARCLLAAGDLAGAEERLKDAGVLPAEVQRQFSLERANQALKRAPNDPDAHLALGRALADQDRWDEALQEFRTAVALSPNSAWTHTDLGEALMKMGADPQQAASEFEAALKLDPQNVEAKIALGDALRRLRKYDEAAACYQTAAQLQPSNWAARHWDALMKFAYGNRDEAAKEMLEVVKLARPKGKHQVAESWGQYSRTRTSHIFQHGFDYPEAVYHCIILDGLETERNGKSQGRALAGLMIGSALVDAGLPEKGDEYLSQALTDPTLGTQARYYHALACQALGKTQEAEQALQQVVTENTRHPTAYKALAEIASQAGDLERAQQFMTKHRQNNPE